MKRSWYAAASLCLAAVLLSGAGSFCAAGEFSAAQMKKMGVFLSNFTELGLCDAVRCTVLHGCRQAGELRDGGRHR